MVKGLISQGYLHEVGVRGSTRSYYSLKTSPLCSQILHGNESFIIKTRGKSIVTKDTKDTPDSNDQPKLKPILTTLRKKIAEREGLAPYQILKPELLESLVAKKPTTLNELKDINTMVSAKIRRYGVDILNEIRKFLSMDEIDETEKKLILEFEKSKSYPITFTQGVRNLIKPSSSPKLSQEDIKNSSSQQKLKPSIVIDDDEEDDDLFEILDKIEQEHQEKSETKKNEKKKFSSFTIKTPSKQFYDD